MNRIEIKELAISIVQSSGLINLSRQSLCLAADIPDGSFPHVMGRTFAALVEELIAEGHDQYAPQTLKKRANPTLRKESILSAAVLLAAKHGYLRVTRDQIAEAAGVSGGLVTRYFGTIAQLRRDIMRKAVSSGQLTVLAQGLAADDPHAKKAPAEMIQKALTSLL